MKSYGQGFALGVYPTASPIKPTGLVWFGFNAPAKYSWDKQGILFDFKELVLWN